MAVAVSLTQTDISAYRERGYHFPLQVLSEDEASEALSRYWAHVEAYREDLESLPPRHRADVFEQTHTTWRWVYDLVSNPRVLDAVEALLGPDIVSWSAKWFSKHPHEGTWVSWHQDATYWSFSEHKVLTCWIALTDSDAGNGGLQVLPGSHLGDLLPYRETDDETNLLSHGQTIDVDTSGAVDMVLRPGQCSLHDVRIAHGSGPNNSDRPRIGLGAVFTTPDVRQEGPNPPQGFLMRGEDRYGHWNLLEPPTTNDYSDEARAEHNARVRRVRENAT